MRTAGGKRRNAGTSSTARRVLMAQAALVAGVVLVVLVREIPGLVREIRIWRMTGNQSGSRHPR